MDLFSSFFWSCIQWLRPYSSTWKQCLDLTRDIVYIQNILGSSSYNVPKTVSHISCFLQGESQVQPPKYKIQTHTQVQPPLLQVPNCIDKIQRRSTWPSSQIRSPDACDNKQRLSQPSLPFLSGSSSVFLSGGFFGVGWIIILRWISCHDCIGFGLLTVRNMLSNDDLLNYHFLNHSWCCLVVNLVPFLTLKRV